MQVVELKQRFAGIPASGDVTAIRDRKAEWYSNTPPRLTQCSAAPYIYIGSLHSTPEPCTVRLAGTSIGWGSSSASAGIPTV